ncbi:Translation machinery-associated protein 22 [Savitreella phatthalungensis]
MAEVENPQEVLSTDGATPATAEKVLPTPPVYCGVCSLPPEYCEYQPTVNKCKEWLEEHHVDLFARYFAGVSLSEKQQKSTEKHEAKQARALEKKLQSKVLVKRIERGKRKYVTGVFGLEVFGIELKPAAKKFAQKFATGASVSKNNEGRDEIVVQGDVSEEVQEYMAADKFFKDVPADNVECIEEKRKSVR